MSTTCEVPFEPLALDGSKYSSWRSNVLIALKVLGPTAEGIMVASILPEDETCVSPMELEKKRLNVVVTNLLCSCVCRELKHLILKSKGICKDGHLSWKLLFGIAHNKWDEVESDDEDEPVEMCPITSTTTIDHQASTLKEEGGKRCEGRVSTFYGEDACLVARKESKKKRQAKGAKSQKIEASSSPQENLNFSNPNSLPWFVSMNIWLTNMIMISNLFHIELR
jgi:hypothetical protein